MDDGRAGTIDRPWTTAVGGVCARAGWIAVAAALLLHAGATMAQEEAKTPPPPTAPPPPAGGPAPRDPVGDLNAEAVRAGEFPGAFKIPGDSLVSLAIGGFVKTTAIADSGAETMGADFLPATLGTKRSDRKGAFSIDTSLTRVFLDGRATLPGGWIRGYVEADLNGNNDGSLGVKVRHAYGTWRRGHGTLTAGHTWSTLMDLGILPEGLTEPTVSGVIFQRQPLIRWSQSFGGGFTYHVAIEDPSSNDVFSEDPVGSFTSVPDGIVGLECGRASWHLRLGGIIRRLEVYESEVLDDPETGWGTTLTGHIDLFTADRLAFSAVHGEGLGRYLLGIQPSAGGAIDATTGATAARRNRGGMLAYKRQWSDSLRSTVMVGAARATPLEWQPGDTFEKSTYASVNLMWRAVRYLTLGAEYGYGSAHDAAGTKLDNHRIAFGIQIY